MSLFFRSAICSASFRRRTLLGGHHDPETIRNGERRDAFPIPARWGTQKRAYGTPADQYLFQFIAGSGVALHVSRRKILETDPFAATVPVARCSPRTATCAPLSLRFL
jgi:hypothetical protein